VNFSETPQLVIINGRFQGPPDSGNGGYSCAMISQFIDDPAAVRLSIPPPLDTPMEVRKSDGRVELYHEGELVASGQPANVEFDIPKPPDFARAQVASGRYRGVV
jgi:hypothetical protein